MNEEKLFTNEELEAMGKRTLDLLLERLEEGDIDESKGLAQRMYNEFLGMHDLYRDWLTHAFTFIGQRFGDEVLREAMQETVAGYTLRLGKRYAGKDKRRQIQMLLAPTFSGITFAQAQRIPGDSFLHGFPQYVVAKSLTDKRKCMRKPVPVQVMHAEEFVVHLLSQILRILHGTIFQFLEQQIQGSFAHVFQLFIGEESFFAHLTPSF